MAARYVSFVKIRFKMEESNFLYYYLLTSALITSLILLIRIYQLSPLKNAEKSHAVIVSNHHLNGILSELGIKIKGTGPVMHISPPDYVADELLLPEANLDIWFTSSIPGLVLTKPPSSWVIFLTALTPCSIFLLILLMPAVFIAKGIYF